MKLINTSFKLYCAINKHCNKYGYCYFSSVLRSPKISAFYSSENLCNRSTSYCYVFFNFPFTLQPPPFLVNFNNLLKHFVDVVTYLKYIIQTFPLLLVIPYRHKRFCNKI